MKEAFETKQKKFGNVIKNLTNLMNEKERISSFSKKTLLLRIK